MLMSAKVSIMILPRLIATAFLIFRPGSLEADHPILEDHLGDAAADRLRQLPVRAHQLLRRQRNRLQAPLSQGISFFFVLVAFVQHFMRDGG